MSATRESIFAAAGRRDICKVSAPALGGDVYVREMLCEERDEWEDGWAKWREKKNGSPQDTRNFYCYLLTHCVCDEGGKPLFTETDVRQLAKIPYRRLRPVITKALEVNGMTATAEQEEEKNSDGGQSAACG